MKKIMMTLIALLTIAATGKAMSYDQARNEALFLTDKMAYELNLTDAQYEAAYEINLDYLMGVTSYDDVFGTYWERRNLDLSYILLDWQWNAFCVATYFYRPLYWRDGFWHFGVYARYPHRDYFFYGRPAFYATYRGGHAWHRVGGRGYYHSRSDHFRHSPAHAPSRSHTGIGRASSHHHPAVTPSHHYSTTTPSHHQSTMTTSHQTQNHQSRPEVNSNHSSHSNHASVNAGGSFSRSHSSGSFSSQSSTPRSGGSFSSHSSAPRSSGSFSSGGAGRSSSSAGRSSGGSHHSGGRR